MLVRLLLLDAHLTKNSADKLDGNELHIVFDSGDTRAVQPCAAQVHAVANREERQPRAPTGRCGAGTSSLTEMLGVNTIPGDTALSKALHHAPVGKYT